MKTIRYIFASWLAVMLFYGCDQGIDDITEVAPGTDATAPKITVNAPTEGLAIKVFEEVTALDVDLEVTDDIEIASISVLLNGTEIAKFSSFKDYRRALEKFTYDNLKDGNHKLTVKATDIEGKTTTVEVNFSKQPPYTQMFDGEIFYMSFDGDYRDQIGFEQATEVGSPGFAGDGYVGPNAYDGAVDSYLTFPSAGLTQGNEFSATFWLKIDASDDRAGIINIAPAEPAGPSDKPSGFGLIREGSATAQKFILLVGNGTNATWVNPGDPATIDPTLDEWVHLGISISESNAALYMNGILVGETAFTGIDWTGVGDLVIMSGDPNFNGWNHKTEKGQMDELRVFDKALSQTEIQLMINSVNPYFPKYDGESFYMPFDGDYIDLVGSRAASAVGTPDFTDDSYEGSKAYAGATDSYLTYPSDGLTTPEFSATMWYKLNNDPNRAGILTIGPEDLANGGYPDIQNNRLSGIRLFREDVGGNQVMKLNIGAGGDNWFDGGAAAALPAGEWAHLAISIGAGEAAVYINGVAVSSGTFPGLDWTGCDVISIMSGAPRFTEWGHLSDNSNLDELRFFNKALSPEEVAEMSGAEFTPKNFGSTLYMPFDGANTEMNDNIEPTVVGTPGFAGESVKGTDAYAGAADSYLSVPIDGLFNNQFSGAFWYKVNGNPDRAGILTVAPPMNGADNVLTSGFRLLREGSADEQQIKLHIGADDGENVWNDGDVIDVTAGEWVHIAFAVSDTATQIYFNGEAVVNSGDMTGRVISWADCVNLSIGSGAPNFAGWNHLSDTSYIDELYLFDRVLTPEEIQALME
ncbi:MAG: LamG domain-containing protein [Maribacter sp.]|uniref:LamG domain-containing protein n=1 Tax=Maribacter sp. TaxID=1897614 RepID=UPI003C794B8B